MTASLLGWLACCVATGLLLQIAVQINFLSWLPDFPVYDTLASFPAILVLWAVPPCLWRAGAMQRITGGLFFVLTIVHFVLTLLSSNSAYLFWRDVALWPALVLGLATCWLTGPKCKAHASLPTPGLVWTLGEAFSALAAIFVAPSAGEATNFANYRFVIYTAWLTVLVCTATWFFVRSTDWGPAFGKLSMTSLVGAVVLTAATFLPGSILHVMLALATARLAAILVVARSVAGTAIKKAAGRGPAAEVHK